MDPSEKVDRLFRQWRRYLLSEARRLAGPSDAEDLVQDTYLQALEKIDQLQEEDRAGGWLRQILVNIYLAKKRKVNRVVVADTQDIPEPTTTGNITLDDLDEARGVGMLLGPEFVDYFVAHTLTGGNRSEIAQMTGLSEHSQRRRERAAREQISEGSGVSDFVTFHEACERYTAYPTDDHYNDMMQYVTDPEKAAWLLARVQFEALFCDIWATASGLPGEEPEGWPRSAYWSMDEDGCPYQEDWAIVAGLVLLTVMGNRIRAVAEGQPTPSDIPFISKCRELLTIYEARSLFFPVPMMVRRAEELTLRIIAELERKKPHPPG